MSNFSLINKENIKNSSFVLDERESHHVVSVLRLKENDQLTLTDGQGTIYKAIVNEAHKKAVKGKILNKKFIKHERNYKVHLALPLIKNSRFKIALEKSVELGVDELTPIRFDKSVKSVGLDAIALHESMYFALVPKTVNPNSSDISQRILSFG